MNTKSTLFNRVLPELKAASAYFTTAAIARRARELGLAKGGNGVASK